MSEQIFISYRREGGDVYARLICESLRKRGFTAFYDYDSIRGGYFDSRIIDAIDACNDFVLVLPKNSLDRCVNENDWVRLEITQAIKSNKNIIPIFLPGFSSFPSNLPEDIASVSRIQGITFIMEYFDAFIDAIVKRLISANETENNDRNIAPKPAPEEPHNSAEPVETAAEPEPIDTDPVELPEEPEEPEDALWETEDEPLEPDDDSDDDYGYDYYDEGCLDFTLNDDGESYSVNVGSCTDTVILIPDTYEGKPVTEIEDNAFADCSFLEAIHIPETVTVIGENAFWNCSSLITLTIPDGVKSIGACAFLNCSSLRSVNIPGGIKVIEKSTFGYCSSLGSVVIPNGVEVIEDYAFRNCSSLTSVDLPDSVTRIGFWAFGYCSSLTLVDISKNVTSIGNFAFDDCVCIMSIYYKGNFLSWQKVRLGMDWNPDHLTSIRCIDGEIML